MESAEVMPCDQVPVNVRNVLFRTTNGDVEAQLPERHRAQSISVMHRVPACGTSPSIA